MTTYAYPNFKTKKELKAAVAKGQHVTLIEKTPFGDREIRSGTHAVSGPHFPEPHKWYAQVNVENGVAVKVV